MTKQTQVTKKKQLDIVIYGDGFLNNKKYGIVKTGGCSVAVVINGKKVHLETIVFPNKRPFTKTRKITVPMMEYFAMYNAMQLARKFNLVDNIIVYSDAETVVQQLNDKWQINNKILQKWYNLVKSITPESVTLLWIKRIANVKILGH